MKRAKIDSDDERLDGEIAVQITNGNQHALVRYFKQFLSKTDADELFDELYALKKEHFTRDLVSTPRGKVLAPRWTAAFGDNGISSYQYAGYTRKTVENWPEKLLACKKQIEESIGVKLNYAFVNIYEIKDDDGNTVEHYIGWHSDSEPEIYTTADGQTTICSISLGDDRKFQLRENYKVGKEKPTEIHTILLEHGSLCTMEKHTQHLCKHQVPKKPGATKVRINITFRLMQGISN